MNNEKKQRALYLQKQRRKLKGPFAHVNFEEIKDNLIDRVELQRLSGLKKTTFINCLENENAPKPIYKQTNRLLYNRTIAIAWLSTIRKPEEINKLKDPYKSIKKKEQQKNNFNSRSLSFLSRPQIKL
jgi:hypothetical protein